MEEVNGSRPMKVKAFPSYSACWCEHNEFVRAFFRYLTCLGTLVASIGHKRLGKSVHTRATGKSFAHDRRRSGPRQPANGDSKPPA